MAAPRCQHDHGHDHGQCGHGGPGRPPPALGKRNSSRVFHDAYSQVPASPTAAECGDVSWRRLGQLVLWDHGFLGAPLYAAILHFWLGVVVWAVGIYANSLALMCYAFIAMYDACALLIALVPRALEYSGNADPSIEYPFALHMLQTLLGFTNNITLLYRAVQALKEGAEHLVSSTHVHSAAAAEFETYARRASGHGRGAALGIAVVAAGMVATAYTAARFANHHSMWEARSRRRQHAAAATGMQNVLLNPYNIASLLAGAWMAVVLALVPADDESAMEPVSCIIIAAAMAYISLPTCVRLGRLLLLAAPADATASARAIAAQIGRMPGVAACSAYRVWSTAHGRYAMALRVTASPPTCNTAVLHRHIVGLLAAAGFSDRAIDIRIS